MILTLLETRFTPVSILNQSKSIASVIQGITTLGTLRIGGIARFFDKTSKLTHADFATADGKRLHHFYRVLRTFIGPRIFFRRCRTHDKKPGVDNHHFRPFAIDIATGPSVEGWRCVRRPDIRGRFRGMAHTRQQQ